MIGPCHLYICTWHRGDKMKISLIVKAILLGSFITACGDSNIQDPNTFYNTGSPLFESQISNLQADDVKLGNEYFVTASALRVRSSAEITSGNILGELKRNEKVRILEDVEGQFVQIEILNSDSDINESPTGKYYTAYAYLSDEKTKNKSYSEYKLSKYFMIQNLATEKLRVYKRGCESGDCPHKMIFEADIAVGEDKSSTRTIAGHFHIKTWHKFYQDGAGNYPSWYDPNYPRMPKAGAGAMAWTKSKVLPYSSASVRGAFGWYTAKVGPDAAYQWTHGTIGWGSDKKEYIEATRGFWANLFADPRSHGCTRTDNESIAYIRHLLPVGSTLIKVYAREAIGDTNFTRYDGPKKASWDYILTKNGVRIDGQKADRTEVLNAGTSTSRYLEEGTLEADIFPTAKVFLSGSSGARQNKNGNYYGLKHGDMTGVFLVDEGRFVKYEHPKRKVRVGGYKTALYPEGVFADDNYHFSLPECKSRYLPLSKKKARRVDSRRKRSAGRCAPYLNADGRFYYKGK